MGRLSSLASTLLLASAASAIPTSFERRNDTQPSDMIYDSADLPATQELVWAPCWDNYECANLAVPWDYEDEAVGLTSVFFIKASSGGDQSSAQDILFNPGGPGGSGVNAILTGFDTQIMENFGGNYNIISFDPRGVNNSALVEPLTCHNMSDPDNYGQMPSPGHSIPLRELYAHSVAIGNFCTKVNAETHARYHGTLAVVQDMMHFHKLNTALKGGDPETEPIWYYGVSYGTVIGQTLAAYYPDRVGRVILDANVYGVQHYEGYAPSAVDDTDQAFKFFFEYCFEAGPEKCAFAGNSTSPQEIETRYLNVLQQLEDNPIPISSGSLPSIYTRRDVMSSAFSAAYGPMSGFPQIAELAAALESGEVSKIAGESVPTGPYPENANYTEEISSSEVLVLVTCVDANGRFPLTNFEEYEKAVQTMTRESVYGGEQIAKANAASCIGLDIAPPTSQVFPGFENTKTAVPVLFIGTTGDPITPLSSAFRMSALFEGSVVLTHDTPGHGYMGIPSNCTTGYVQAYLESGDMPPDGTICEPDVSAAPFMQDQDPAKMVRRFAKHW
ncbi:alpha/beta-hydrolase [Polyplosphaeria fusca]|uniref:Alpha/beta-hydrolase n=1 Tax=Polyplosphaeria fusca TaxID=682080 RepID=A0A9P4V1S3_9PLEO|nr:alpha/beta-hydrolase [Polyplosphaeria fusca]